MIDLNITPDMTKEMVIAAAHKATAVPSMIITYFLLAIVLFGAALMFKDKDTSWGNFAWIWATTMIAMGAFIVFLIFCPNVVQWVVTKFDWLIS